MGLADLLKDETVEIKCGKLYELLKEAARAELFRNGVKNKVPYEHILQVMDGNADALVNIEPIWHDAKTDPPKEPGMYYGRKDDTNSMWLCQYARGVWNIDGGLPEKPVDIVQWAEYAAFKSED